jgi:photosystem II stability/assembly factor-like uncharacterized protein
MRDRLLAFFVGLAILLCIRQGVGAQWLQTAGPEGCIVKAMDVDGSDVYAVVEGYGTYASKDNGLQWASMKVGLPPGNEITCIEVAGGKIYTGTDRGIVCFSIDGGASWRRIDAGSKKEGRVPGEVVCLAVVGTDLFVGKSDGVYIFPDYGNSSAVLRLDLPVLRGIHSIAVVGTDLFVGGSNEAVFLVRNDGKGWNASALPFPRNNRNRLDNGATCIEASGPNLFAGSSRGIFLSSDKGASWTNIWPGLPKGSEVSCIAVSGANLVAGLRYSYDERAVSAGVLLSSGKERSWKTTGLGLKHIFIECLEAAGAVLFAGTSEGIFISRDGGITWDPANSGLPVASCVAHLAVAGPNLFAGTSHSYPRDEQGGLYLSPDGGRSWKAAGADLPSGSSVACLASVGPNLFAGLSTQGDEGMGVYHSPNNGRTWITVNSGLPPGSTVHQLAVIRQDLYAGTRDGIFMSKDNGATWTERSEGLPVISTTSGSFISYLAATEEALLVGVSSFGGGFSMRGPSFPGLISLSVGGQYLFAGPPPATNGLFRLAKGSARWKDTRIRLTRRIDSLAVIGSKIFMGTENGIYLCENYLESPKALKLQMSSTSWLCQLAAVGTNLIVSTRAGVHIIREDGGKWRLVDTGLPENIYVRCFALTETDLYAGTDGHGIWRLPLSDITNSKR